MIRFVYRNIIHRCEYTQSLKVVFVPSGDPNPLKNNRHQRHFVEDVCLALHVD